jgi:hypothetical protein
MLSILNNDFHVGDLLKVQFLEHTFARSSSPAGATRTVSLLQEYQDELDQRYALIGFGLAMVSMEGMNN